MARTIHKNRVAVKDGAIDITEVKSTVHIAAGQLKYHFQWEAWGSHVLTLVTAEGTVHLHDVFDASLDEIGSALGHVVPPEELFSSESKSDGAVTHDRGRRRFWLGGLAGGVLVGLGGVLAWSFVRMVEYGPAFQPFLWPTLGMMLILVVPGVAAFLRWPILRVRQGIVVGRDFVVSLGLWPSVVWIRSIRAIERRYTNGATLVLTMRNGSWMQVRNVDLEPLLRERAGLPRDFLYYEEVLDLLGPPRWKNALCLIFEGKPGAAVRTYTREEVEALRRA
jgi:hypothetical protein